MNKISLLLICIFFTACNSITDPIKMDDDLNAKPIALSGFDLDLFRAECALVDGNVILSPFSVSNVTKMVLAAAYGETEEEIINTYQSKAKSELLQSNKSLMAQVNALDSNLLTCVNTFYYDKSKITVDSEFETHLNEYFDASGNGRDFSDLQATLDAINGWCHQNTNGRIPKILDDISSDEIMFLLNAIYLKASWASPFDPNSTRDADFTLKNGQKVTASYMYQDNRFNHAQYQNAEMMELPYRDEELSLCLIKPKEVDIDNYISGFDQATLDSLLANRQKKRYMLHVPKFTLEYESKNMKPTFGLMGINKMFTPTAELNLSTPSNTMVSRIVHKTYFSIDEKGTEGAAVTAGGIVLTSMPPSFRLDSPFLFVLRHNQTGQILFVGRIMNPSS